MDSGKALQLFIERDFYERLRNHPVFWKNCRAQRRRTAKICQDCPFIEVVEKVAPK